MSGSDRQGAYLARGVLSLYGLLSAAPARLPVPEPCYDNLETLAIEPGSNGLWRVHERGYRDQMAPLFALRTRKSHGDLRSWPPISRGPGPAKHLRSRLFACDSTDVWPDSHLGFGTFFAFRPRFGVLARHFRSDAREGARAGQSLRRRDLSSSIDDFGAPFPTC